MFHGHLDHLQKALLGGRLDTKPGRAQHLYIGHLCLGVVWLVVDLRTNTKKICVEKRVDYISVLKICLAIPGLILNMIGRSCMTTK